MSVVAASFKKKPGRSRHQPFPTVTDPEAPPLRTQRHVPNSIATIRQRLIVALAKRLPFFFQAEDGIRDYKGTGVQTCALPISRRACRACVEKRNGVGLTFGTRGARVENELNSFGFECFLELGGNLGIFTRNNLRALMQNGDAAAEPAKHLAEFEADVATAEDQEMFGNGGEPHDGFVGEIGNGFETENQWDTRTATGVDENPFAFEGILADLELMRRDKTRVAAIKAKFGALVYLFLLAATEAQDHLVFLSDDFGEIDADVGSVDAPACGISR